MRSASCVLIGLALLTPLGCHKQGGTATATASASECASVVGAALERAMRIGMTTGAAERGAVGSGVQAEISKLSGDAAASLAPMKDALIRACREDAWPAAELACLGSASTGDAFDACQDKLTEAQRRHSEQLVDEASAKAARSGTPECSRYADYEIKCGKATESDRPVILQFCAKARAGAGDVTYQLIALESTCAQTASDCDSYKTCIAQAKATHRPK